MRLAIAGFALGLACASPVRAIPRYAALYAQNCGLCHVNPTGGGLRGLYASQVLVPTELAMRGAGPGEVPRIDPQVGENLTVGADLRTLWLASGGGAAESGFFQMQSTVYFGFQLDERWAAVISAAQNGTVDAYGLGWVLPAAGYVKVGRFAPPVGLQLEDHTAAVREGLGLAPPRHTDTGVEIGLQPGRWAFSAAVLNGAPGVARDTDRSLALAGRVLARARVGPLQLAAGGSIWRNEEREGTRTAGGPLGMASWGPLAWLGEFDWSRLAGDAGEVTAFLATQELSWSVRRGLELRGTWSFRDPDLDRLGGAQTRWGAGFDARPYPFLGLQAMLNLHRREQGPDLAGRDDLQTVVMLHVFY